MTGADQDTGVHAFADLIPIAQPIVRAFADKGWMVATAESCTGGLVAALLTEVPGSSAVVDRGFVTYSNEAKADLLGVPADLIKSHGAVSAPVAKAMAEGALARSRAAAAVSVTGIAGPGGGSPEKPVGTVHFGLAVAGQPVRHHHRVFADHGRASIRLESVRTAIEFLSAALQPAKQG